MVKFSIFFKQRYWEDFHGFLIYSAPRSVSNGGIARQTKQNITKQHEHKNDINRGYMVMDIWRVVNDYRIFQKYIWKFYCRLVNTTNSSDLEAWTCFQSFLLTLDRSLSNISWSAWESKGCVLYWLIHNLTI